MSITTRVNYDSEDYDSFEDEIEDVLNALDAELDINYFEGARGNAVAQVQQDLEGAKGEVERILEGSASNLGMRDKYFVLN